MVHLLSRSKDLLLLHSTVIRVSLLDFTAGATTAYLMMMSLLFHDRVMVSGSWRYLRLAWVRGSGVRTDKLDIASATRQVVRAVRDERGVLASMCALHCGDHLRPGMLLHVVSSGYRRLRIGRRLVQRSHERRVRLDCTTSPTNDYLQVVIFSIRCLCMSWLSVTGATKLDMVWF